MLSRFSRNSPSLSPPLSPPPAKKYMDYLASPKSLSSQSSVRSTPSLSAPSSPPPPAGALGAPGSQIQHIEKEIVIDENLRKINNEYIYSNGSLYWISNMPCYLVNTGIAFENEYEIRILYILRGEQALKKRYGYFDSCGVFQECEIV